MIEEEKAAVTNPCPLVECNEEEVQVVSIPKEEIKKGRGRISFGKIVSEEEEEEKRILETKIENKPSFRIAADLISKSKSRKRTAIERNEWKDDAIMFGGKEWDEQIRKKRSEDIGLYGGINVSQVGKLVLVGFSKILEEQIENKELQDRLSAWAEIPPRQGSKFITINPYEFTRMIFDQAKPAKKQIDQVSDFIRKASGVDYVEEYKITEASGETKTIRDTRKLFYVIGNREVISSNGTKSKYAVILLRSIFVNGLKGNYISLPNNVFKILALGRRTSLKNELYFMLAERANDRGIGKVEDGKIRVYEINQYDLLSRLKATAARYKDHQKDFAKDFNDAIKDLKEAGLIIDYQTRNKGGVLTAVFKLNMEHAKEIKELPGEQPKGKRGGRKGKGKSTKN